MDLNKKQESMISVVIPLYKNKDKILDVVAAMPELVGRIYIVDDACPDQSGQYVESVCTDPRVKLLYNEKNQGVGGAVIAGYRQALAESSEIIIKIDSDGQMDPALIPDFIAPILAGEADYTKGNRFFNPEGLHAMPFLRLFGNATLSFMTKLSSGYWNLFDPTNGYTAIHASALSLLPFDKISQRYFFETDMLFRLNLQRAVVVDIPMLAKYEDEESSLKIHKILFEFSFKHFRNFMKRIFYNYYLRDMSFASLELVFGISFLMFGLIYGGYHWVNSVLTSIPTLPGSVMLSALPVIIGIQLLLGFLAYDMQSVPTLAIQRNKIFFAKKKAENTKS